MTSQEPKTDVALGFTITSGLAVFVGLVLAFTVRSNADACGRPANLPSGAAAIAALFGGLFALGALIASGVGARKAKGFGLPTRSFKTLGVVSWGLMLGSGALLLYVVIANFTICF